MRGKIHTLLIVILAFIITLPQRTWAEGSKELLNNIATNYGAVIICGSFANLNTFHYNNPVEEQLRLRISNSTEQVYMCFNVCNTSGGETYSSTSSERYDTYVRVRRLSDNTLVFGPHLLTNTAAGYVATPAPAIAGPAALVGAAGYTDPILFTPGAAGDYIIEFAVSNTVANTTARFARFLDITVHDPAMPGVPGIRTGRLHARTWGLTCHGTSQRFWGMLYAYSADSVVTSFNLNGMQPGGFDITCNSYGVRSDLTSFINRQSDFSVALANDGVTQPGAPDYRIFLNDPDILEFPTGTVGELRSFEVTPCSQLNYCVNVDVSKSGNVRVRLDFPNGTFREFVEAVSTGVNCVEWDGLDGNGNAVDDGTAIDVTVGYLTGLTHLPLRDVEHNTNGFIISLVRPTTTVDGDPLSPPLLYWDDSKINTGTATDGLTNFTGASGAAHRWSNRGADNNNQEWINTWWYANETQDQIVFEVDSSAWIVTGVLNVPSSCEVQTTLTMYARFRHSHVNIEDVSYAFTTNYPSYFMLLHTDTTQVADSTFIILTYAVDHHLNSQPPPISLSWNVQSHTSEFPQCNSASSHNCAMVVLPVDILAFKGHKTRQGHHLLQWNTRREDQLDSYLLEHAMEADPGHFTPLAAVLATGNSLYEYVHPNPASGVHYYRLHYLNTDGSGGMASNIVTLLMEPAPPQLNYSPGLQSIRVMQPQEQGNYTLKVFDMLGREVTSCNQCHNLELGDLVRGIYLVRLFDQHRFITEKKFTIY
ncbi:MAG: hypothetical protein KF690_01765 [Bacteroidetes bacterium]|nr:hypothetical protein [Bacteroidota bacterium]